MNEYIFDEITVGMEESFETVITKEKTDAFLFLSEDDNPLHTDEIYAVGQGYHGKVVYGMLTASLFSRLGGVHLPGKYCLFYECNVKFNRPVYEGDLLTVTGKVIEKIEFPLKRIVVKGIIKNKNKEIVSMARLILGVTK